MPSSHITKTSIATWWFNCVSTLLLFAMFYIKYSHYGWRLIVNNGANVWRRKWYEQRAWDGRAERCVWVCFVLCILALIYPHSLVALNLTQSNSSLFNKSNNLWFTCYLSQTCSIFHPTWYLHSTKSNPFSWVLERWILRLRWNTVRTLCCYQRWLLPLNK